MIYKIWNNKFFCLLKSCAYSVPIVIAFSDIFGYIAKVEGASMQPTLNPLQDGSTKSDFLLLNCWKLRNFEIKRGELIAFVCPSNPNQKLIKRVIGLESDIIQTPYYKRTIVKIPPGHCWVEGDNHPYSFDSNTFGPVPLGLVDSKATHIVWPPSRWQKLPTDSDLTSTRHASTFELWKSYFF